MSGTQLLLPASGPGETWSKYPEGQNRLFDTIRRAEAEGVVFITSDKHYAEVARRDDIMGYDAVELQLASINQIEPAKHNPDRVASTIDSRHSYTLLDLQTVPSEQNPPHLQFRVFNALSGRVELEYRVNLRELTFD